MAKEIGPIYGVELIDTLPICGGAMYQQMPSRADLDRVREYCERVVAGYEVVLDHYTSIIADCPTLNLRKCRDCGNVAYHADSVTPHVLCKKCGSQDTRKVKVAS